MPKKYYAVKSGRKTGIFLTWSECKEQIDGFPSAVYKSFLKKEEAENWLNSSSGVATQKDEKEVFDDDTAIAYVDGSFRQDTGEFSSGAVLFYKGKAFRFSKKFSDPEMAEMRNVAGEIMGSVSVIRYCLNNNIGKIVVYHDYEGIARWATGDWKAKKAGTQAYREFCLDAMSKMEINFRKVKGHSGDKYNDMADKLAKEALGI
ncbi:MAG: ribonuclease H family protein [Clostridia bacterium]|nr:ribonuclease H family protein [Clostridia bacterium]